MNKENIIEICNRLRLKRWHKTLTEWRESYPQSDPYHSEYLKRKSEELESFVIRDYFEYLQSQNNLEIGKIKSKYRNLRKKLWDMVNNKIIADKTGKRAQALRDSYKDQLFELKTEEAGEITEYIDKEAIDKK